MWDDEHVGFGHVGPCVQAHHHETNGQPMSMRARSGSLSALLPLHRADRGRAHLTDPWKRSRTAFHLHLGVHLAWAEARVDPRNDSSSAGQPFEAQLVTASVIPHRISPVFWAEKELQVFIFAAPWGARAVVFFLSYVFVDGVLRAAHGSVDSFSSR